MHINYENTIQESFEKAKINEGIIDALAAKAGEWVGQKIQNKMDRKQLVNHLRNSHAHFDNYRNLYMQSRDQATLQNMKKMGELFMQGWQQYTQLTGMQPSQDRKYLGADASAMQKRYVDIAKNVEEVEKMSKKQEYKKATEEAEQKERAEVQKIPQRFYGKYIQWRNEMQQYKAKPNDRRARNLNMLRDEAYKLLSSFYNSENKYPDFKDESGKVWSAEDMWNEIENETPESPEEVARKELRDTVKKRRSERYVENTPEQKKQPPNLADLENIMKGLSADQLQQLLNQANYFYGQNLKTKQRG